MKMKKYIMIIVNKLKTLFTYRARVIFQILSSVLAIVIQYYLWFSIYSTKYGGLEKAIIKGLSFNQTFAYVAIASSTIILLKTSIDWDINKHVNSGDIILYLYKPLDYMQYMFASSLGTVLGNFLTVTIPSYFMIFYVFKAKIIIGWNITFFLITMCGGYVLSFLFDFLIGITCFWTMSIWGISKGKDLIITFLSGALIPLNFYPEKISLVLNYLPFSYIYNVPISILTSNEQFPIKWCVVCLFQILWILIIFFITKEYYKYTIKYLSINGG